MTHTEATNRIAELLAAVETLRVDKPVGPAVSASVRATATRIIDEYLHDAGAQPARSELRNENGDNQ